MSDTLTVVRPASPASREPHAGSVPRRGMDTFLTPALDRRPRAGTAEGVPPALYARVAAVVALA